MGTKQAPVSSSAGPRYMTIGQSHLHPASGSGGPVGTHLMEGMCGPWASAFSLPLPGQGVDGAHRKGTQHVHQGAA